MTEDVPLTNTVAKLASNLNAHEKVCVERGKNIDIQFAGVNSRIKRLEVIIMSTTSVVILLLIGLVVKGL